MLFSHQCLSSQSCESTRFQTSGYVTIPSENFSLVGYKKDPDRKGRRWFFLRASHPLSPLTNFPFLARLPGLLSFSLHSPYILVRKPRKEDHCNWAGSSHKPTSGGPPPRTLPRNWDALWGQDSPLALLSWQPHTGSHFIHRLKGEWNPILLDPISLLTHFQVLVLGGSILKALGPLALCPHLTLKQGMPISKQTITTLWESPKKRDAFSFRPFSSASLSLV